jgi:hypothetical protein
MSSDATFKKIRGMAILAIVLYDPLVRKIVVLFEMILEVKDSDGFGCEATGKYSLFFSVASELMTSFGFGPLNPAVMMADGSKNQF